MNVTVQLNDSYQALAAVNTGSGFIYGTFNLLVDNEDKTHNVGENLMFVKSPLFANSNLQAELFSITFNSSVMNSLTSVGVGDHAIPDVRQVMIKVQFKHQDFKKGNNTSCAAYITVLLQSSTNFNMPNCSNYQSIVTDSSSEEVPIYTTVTPDSVPSTTIQEQDNVLNLIDNPSLTTSKCSFLHQIDLFRQILFLAFPFTVLIFSLVFV